MTNIEKYNQIFAETLNLGGIDILSKNYEIEF